MLAKNRDINDSLKKTLNTKSLYDFYLTKFKKEKRDEYRAKFSVDGENPDKFVEFPEDPKAFFVPRKEPYAVSVPCKLIYSCPDYNRTYEVDYNSCVKNLEKYGYKFVCEAADEDGNPITLYYDSLRNEFRTTRGNHRTIMKFLTDGPDATIEAYIKVHHENATDDEMFMKEANSFDADNTQKGQTKGSLFKGKLFNALGNPDAPQWPVVLYEYLDGLDLPVGIAETNMDTKINVDGFSTISKKMIEVTDDKNLEDKYHKLSVVLNRLVHYAVPKNPKTGIKEGTIKADCVEHLLLFREKFSKEIKAVDSINKIDSFDDFVDYIFNLRATASNGIFKNLTMQTLTHNSSNIRVHAWYVANLCTLYNEFCMVNDLKSGHAAKDANKKMVISRDLKSWRHFMDDCVTWSFQKAVEGQLSEFFNR